MKPALFIFAFAAALVFSATHFGQDRSEDYLKWTASQADAIGKSTRERGKAGGYFDSRVFSTNKAINYEVRATMMTPEVIRATARVIQLRDRLTDDQTRKLVADAEAAGDLVIMIEIDPNEGSGVIPLDWRVFLQPKGLPAGSPGAVPGVKSPQLQKIPTLVGLFGRNYSYDIFWVAFPLVDKDRKPLISPDTAEIQLIVGIYSKEARISWRMPASVRDRINRLASN